MSHLVGRAAECGRLDEVIRAVEAGQSRTLVLRGPAGVGKTALVEYAMRGSRAASVGYAVGIEAEMELTYAALQQVCASLTERLDNLVVPQRDALTVALGMGAGPRPDPMLVGLAALNLFADVARERPFVCVIDDEQWIDRASAQALTFVSRRLGAESVGMLFTTRTGSVELDGLPTLDVEGLGNEDSRKVFEAALTGPVDPDVVHRLVAELGGNPLTLREYARSLSGHDMAGGFAVPVSGARSDVEDIYRRRIGGLPDETQLWLALAAAEPVGDAALLWRASAALGVGGEASVPAVEAGVIEIGATVRFPHPLVRAAAYGSASQASRRAIHTALAEATDPGVDPDRRAWHRAHSAAGPDDVLADELEDSAGRAESRGGHAAAGAFLDRAVALTCDPVRRAARAVSAAEIHARAGSFENARRLLAVAESGPRTRQLQAQAEVILAGIAFATNRGADAPPLLLKAATLLSEAGSELAGDAFLDAMSAAIFAEPLAAGAARDVAEIASGAGTALQGCPKASELLLKGFTDYFTAGYSTSVPTLREALATLAVAPSPQQLRRLWVANVAAVHLWDVEAWCTLSRRYEDLARRQGATSELPLALTSLAVSRLFTRGVEPASCVIEEIDVVSDVVGTIRAPYARLVASAMRGDSIAASVTIGAALDDAARRGEGVGVTAAEHANALLHNGLGHYRVAMESASRAAADPNGLGSSSWAVVELVEAAARSGETVAAREALERLSAMAAAAGSAWSSGVEARSRALLAPEHVAEHYYREAIEHLSTTALRPELSRTHLVYGEWLRRQRRRTDARQHLRTAHSTFTELGMQGFAERARRELQAAGEPTGRSANLRGDGRLTAQEAQIARLAKEGLSNPEIGARLFISARTVQYHLRKVFAKLNIQSRVQLEHALVPSTR